MRWLSCSLSYSLSLNRYFLTNARVCAFFRSFSRAPLALSLASSLSLLSPRARAHSLWLSLCLVFSRCLSFSPPPYFSLAHSLTHPPTYIHTHQKHTHTPATLARERATRCESWLCVWDNSKRDSNEYVSSTVLNPYLQSSGCIHKKNTI